MSLFVKSPTAVLDFGFDWTDWLDSGETIEASSWSVPSGLTNAGETFSTTQTKIWLSGGTAGTEYTVTNTIETTESATEEVRSFILLVDVFRVTVDEVKQIITIPSTVDVVPFIRAANLTVTKRVGTNTSLSTAQKKEIERWLVAHFLSMGPIRQASYEKLGEAEVSYAGKYDNLGLDATSYGQQVKLLDTTGLLANLGKQGITFKAVPRIGGK